MTTNSITTGDNPQIMRTAFLSILITACCWPVSAGQIHWDLWIDAVEQVESAGGRRLVGDGGRSLGHYQMSARAWIDASSELGRDKMAKALGSSWSDRGYAAWVFNREISQEHAIAYALRLYRQLNKALGRPATAGEVYAAYNMGFTGFKRRSFNLSKVPAHTRRCAEFIQQYSTK